MNCHCRLRCLRRHATSSSQKIVCTFAFAARRVARDADEIKKQLLTLRTRREMLARIIAAIVVVVVNSIDDDIIRQELPVAHLLSLGLEGLLKITWLVATQVHGVSRPQPHLRRFCPHGAPHTLRQKRLIAAPESEPCQQHIFTLDVGCLCSQRCWRTAWACLHTRTCIRTHKHAHTHTHSLSLSHTHAHTRTHTHTHTHTLSLSPFLSLSHIHARTHTHNTYTHIHTYEYILFI